MFFVLPCSALYNSCMEITKYAHACFVAIKDGQSVVVDPGELSSNFTVPKNPVAVVVTHIHGDHWSADHLTQMPNVPVFAPDDAANRLRELNLNVIVVAPGETKQVGNFKLTFTGGQHALIHPDTPMCRNVGVLINDGEVYYPGDSFASAGMPIETLAVPIAAPWMKTAEAMDYLTQVRPKRAFPTHDAVLSEAGKQFADNWMKQAAEKSGTIYERI